ncbi:MAG: LptF/LptG family permease [Thermoflexibacter sp.]|jgi:lipopolysaccharide export system permease protein|nr:LptF/LptG family permease [Thermoflexibacter sp.]
MLFTKIDKLVSKAFIPTFFLTFFVVLFILFTVFISQYLEDLVGKDLGVEVYLRVFFYFALTLTPMTFPLATLLASLMCFGNLGEHSELTAIKGAGISLPRILFPVGIYAILIAIGAFLSNNYVAPEANLRAYSLIYDIRQKKPALEFKEGGFYNDLPDYRIRIEKKDRDGGNGIYGVMIYDHSTRRGNTDLIIADTGKMYNILDNNYLVMELQNGHRFSEPASDNTYKREFVRDNFKKAKFVFSLEALGMNRTPEELFKSHRVMMTMSELRDVADSLENESVKYLSTTPYTSKPYYDYQFGSIANDSIKNGLDTFPKHYTLFKKVINPEDMFTFYDKAINKTRNLKNLMTASKERIETLSTDSRIYRIEMYQKVTFSVACFIMFLIGAPLGAIIKKGGFGIPVLVSIVFFILFYVLTITGQKYAKEGVTDVLSGTWMANGVLLLFGIFFLRQAYFDSRLFDADVYYIIFQKLKEKYWKPYFAKKPKIQVVE